MNTRTTMTGVNKYNTIATIERIAKAKESMGLFSNKHEHIVEVAREQSITLFI